MYEEYLNYVKEYFDLHVGYSETKGKEYNAKMGSQIFNEYAIKTKMDSAFVEKVKNLIELHSSKQLLKEVIYQ